MSGTPGTNVRNEQTKLTATAVSNVGAAFIIAGFVAPLVSGQLSFGRGLLALVWVAGGIGLHVGARALLGGIQ